VGYVAYSVEMRKECNSSHVTPKGKRSHETWPIGRLL
jgi:hypothetical protein